MKYYKLPAGSQVDEGYECQRLLPNATASRCSNARVMIAHDSCLKTDSLRPLVHKDTLPLSLYPADPREMGKVLATNCSARQKMPGVMILIGGLDVLRKIVPENDFDNQAPTPHMIEKAVRRFLINLMALWDLHIAGKLAAKLILAAPPGLGRRRKEIQGLFQIFAALARQADMPYIFTGSDIFLAKDQAPSCMVGPSTWKFLTCLSHSLPSCGFTPSFVLSQSDLVGRDLYNFWLRMHAQHGFASTCLDGYSCLDHEEWDENQTPLEAIGVKESGLIQRATTQMNSFGDTTNTYAAHAVHKAQGALIGYRTKTPLLTYPEPPIKFKLSERPRQDDANAGLNKFRAGAHVYYENHTKARNSYKRWARANDLIFRLRW